MGMGMDRKRALEILGINGAGGEPELQAAIADLKIVWDPARFTDEALARKAVANLARFEEAYQIALAAIRDNPPELKVQSVDSRPSDLPIEAPSVPPSVTGQDTAEALCEPVEPTLEVANTRAPSWSFAPWYPFILLVVGGLFAYAQSNNSKQRTSDSKDIEAKMIADCLQGSAIDCSELGFLERQAMFEARERCDREGGEVCSKYFHLATKQCGGDPRMCNHLGVAYAKGTGTATDVERAKGLFKVACDADEKYACVNLSHTESIDVALQLLDKACDSGGVGVPGVLPERDAIRGEACFLYAKRCAECTPSRDRKRAFSGACLQCTSTQLSKLQKSCALNYQDGCAALGEWHLKAGDVETATPILSLACRNGSARACESLSTVNGKN